MFFVGSQGAWEGVGGKATREAAQTLGIALVNAVVLSPINELAYRRTFEAMKRDQADGLVFSNDVESYGHRTLLVELVQQIGLPAIYVFREQAEAGGLMSYSADLKSAIITSARQGVEILRGGNPAEMPYVLGARFELVINLKTAKALDLKLLSFRQEVNRFQ